MPINRVLKAIEEIQKGNIIVMLDDEDRENEGDLVYAGIFSTPEKVNFLASKAKGLICTSISSEIANRLELTPMVDRNSESFSTAFTISVDDKCSTTGISAFERDMTIKRLANPLSRADDLVRPGHIFPLIAKDGGVLVRTGHTEGSVDICRLAGVCECAVICEVMKDNGEMARRDDLREFAKEHNLHTLYISDIVEYRLKNESLIQELSRYQSEIFGYRCEVVEFLDHLNHKHYGFLFGELKSERAIVKFHNIASDVELFLKPKKLKSVINSIELIQKDGGALIFLSDNLKSEDSVREFGIGAQILNKLNIKNLELITTQGHREFVGIGGFDLNILKEIEL